MPTCRYRLRCFPRKIIFIGNSDASVSPKFVRFSYGITALASAWLLKGIVEIPHKYSGRYILKFTNTETERNCLIYFE